MSVVTDVSLYESGLLETATGGILRPGGMELTARAIEQCGVKSGAKVVDVGCGNGTTVEYLRASLGLDAIGVDPSAILLERGSERNSVLPLVCGRAEDLPVDSSTQDAVIAECSLSLVTDMDKALAEFWRVLVPGGRLAVTDIYARNPDGISSLRAMPVSCLAGIMSIEELKSKLVRQGFIVDVFEDHSQVLKEFMIRLIMQGSAQSLWQCAGGNTGSWGEMWAAAKQARPGYFLLIAHKSRTTEG
jgi:ubiquinone/menaquinone biosynthesis C-methylase UbiE